MSENISVKYTKRQHFDPIPFGEASKDSDLITGSLVIGEGPRKYHPPFNGTPDAYKSSCRIVCPVIRPDDIPARVPRPQEHTMTFTTLTRDRDRRHLRDSDLPCVVSPKDRELNWTRKKTVLYGDDKQPRYNFKSKEYSIESQFDRKQRINDINIGKKRNFIPISTMGDKPYVTPDRSCGFYKEGGLIPGSSIVQRKQKSSVPENKTACGMKALKSLTAHEKRELESINLDKSSIKALTNSCYKRGQQLPSWEEKTGMWLCRPEDEND